MKKEELEALLKAERDESTFWGNVFGLFWAVVIALFIRSVAFEPYNIPSSSMVPTLLVGDYLFISKYPYGYSKHSFPFSLPIIPKGRVFEKTPQRGDVAIFKEPVHNSVDYIKRVIGLPGDTVQMKEGRLYINEKQVPRTYLSSETYTNEKKETHLFKKYAETLPNGVTHFIYELSDDLQQDNTPPIFVPDGYYFMMGDNRDNSYDSRFFGLVPAENLEGRAEFIFYSTNGNGNFYEFWKWSDFIRKDRLFTSID